MMCSSLRGTQAHMTTSENESRVSQEVDKHNNNNTCGSALRPLTLVRVRANLLAQAHWFTNIHIEQRIPGRTVSLTDPPSADVRPGEHSDDERSTEGKCACQTTHTTQRHGQSAVLCGA